MPSSLPAPSFAPSLTLLTPPVDGNHRLTGAQIRLAEGQHALAQISVLTPLDPSQSAVNAAVPANLTWPDFTPVHFTYGSSLSDVTDFYGYIASSRIQPERTPTRLAGIATATVQYTLTGTSMFMQSPQSRSYLNTTASAIARQVAAAHQLAVYTTPSPRVFPAKTQANQSDFAFLQALAAQVGARCWIDNSLMYFTDAATNIDPAGVAVPSFAHNRAPGQWDTLGQWQPTVGESDPTGAILTSHTATTVRSASGQIASATITPQRISGGQTSAPALSCVVRGQLAGSRGEAEQIAQAAANNQRYWVSASATVDGNTALRPGRQVTVTGNAISGSDAGTWRICQAVHKITLDLVASYHNTYLCELSVGRDQEGSLSLTQPVVPAPLPGPMNLIGTTWQATRYGQRHMSAEIYEAVVVATTDPLGLGRIKVAVPQVAGTAVSTWAQPTVRTHGAPPLTGSTVWVSLDTGDASKPVYHAAGLYSAWTSLPTEALGAGFSGASAAYRTGPAGAVQWRGQVSTTTSPLTTGAALLTAPPAPAAAGAPAQFALIATPGGSTPSAVPVQLAANGLLSYLGASLSFSGTLTVNLAPLAYSTL